MRHISHVQSQGDSKDTKFLDDLSTHLYTTLAKINAALSTPSFLTITGDLLQHNDVLVRKTALSMFIEKIEDAEAFVRETSQRGPWATFNPVRPLVRAESEPATYLSSNPTSPQGDIREILNQTSQL